MKEKKTLLLTLWVQLPSCKFYSEEKLSNKGFYIPLEI